MTSSPRPGGLFWRAIVFAVVYAVTAKVGLTLAFAHPSATAVWPPTGIALAALLLWGYRIWPAVFVPALLVNLDNGRIHHHLDGHRARQHARGAGRMLPREPIRRRTCRLRAPGKHAQVRGARGALQHDRERHAE